MSQKPAIFFSHSSKDKENIVALKNALDRITGGALDIFLSSDGQSIRFGTNWIHSIEDGLNTAEIMFVFVTPNSLQSDWIYFEAGYAYHKGIDVIPVGVGVDIGLLKPPLNLLQGFNLSNIESLNNIITIINDKFEFSFTPSFMSEDFYNVCKLDSGSQNSWTDFIDHIDTTFHKEHKSKEETELTDFKEAYNKIVEYLEQNQIAHAKSTDSRQNSNILVYGISIAFHISELSVYDMNSYIDFRVSPYNFQKSFNLLMALLNILKNTTNLITKNRWYIKIFTTENYSLLIDSEKIMSILLDSPDKFSPDPSHTSWFIYKSLEFSVQEGAEKRHIHIIYPLSNNSVLEINDLLNDLMKLKIIRKK